MRKFGFLVLLILTGCASNGSGPWDHTPDTKRFNQKIGTELASADNSVEFDAAKYRQMWFAPWHRSAVGDSYKSIHWARSYASTTTFNRKGKQNTAEHWQAVLANSNQAGFASLMQNAIAVRGSALRALPTNTAAFKDPSRPGEGYPFDYLANAHLKLNTPVKILNYSLDGQWALVQTPWIPSWVEASAIAPIDNSLIAKLQSLPLAVVVDERDRQSAMRIGTLMFKPSGQLLQAGTNAQGQATLINADIAATSALPFPAAFNDQNIQRVANQLIGEAYGWGEIDFMRDCSALTRDFFAVFGRFLPRNSKAQAKQGTVIEVAGLSRQQKNRILRQQAIPFQTLIYLPGHIMIYIGERNNELIAFHNIWGIRTRESDNSIGRWVMGKGVITSLEPGRHLKTYEGDRSSLLLKASKFVILKQSD